MISFATVRPLSEAKRIRMGLPPLPSNLLRMVQNVAGKESDKSADKENIEKENSKKTPTLPTK
jgi:hypothetical protein